MGSSWTLATAGCLLKSGVDHGWPAGPTFGRTLAGATSICSNATSSPPGGIELGKLTVSAVRAWHAALLVELPAVAPKAYQVLRTTLNTAVADGLLVVNPCKIKGAGQAHHEERPVASVAEVGDLADAVDPRWRAMVLLAYWCGLRLGELRALRRKDLDLLHRWVQVREQVADVGGRLLTGPPKTDAGRRRVAIPPHIQDALAHHLEIFVGPEPDAYVFTGHHGAAPLPSATWRRAWDEARRTTGLLHLHLHDLRHAGNTLAAATGDRHLGEGEQRLGL